MKRILGTKQASPAIVTTAPTGNDGITMSSFDGQTKARWWLLTVVVSVAPSDLTVWGALPAGVPADGTDDIWGKHQDEYLVAPLGKMATALPIGTYHFVISDLGLYSRVAIQKSAGTMTATLTEVFEAGRGN